MDRAASGRDSTVRVDDGRGKKGTGRAGGSGTSGGRGGVHDRPERPAEGYASRAALLPAGREGYASHAASSTAGHGKRLHDRDQGYGAETSHAHKKRGSGGDRILPSTGREGSSATRDEFREYAEALRRRDRRGRDEGGREGESKEKGRGRIPPHVEGHGRDHVSACRVDFCFVLCLFPPLCRGLCGAVFISRGCRMVGCVVEALCSRYEKGLAGSEMFGKQIVTGC